MKFKLICTVYQFSVYLMQKYLYILNICTYIVILIATSFYIECTNLCRVFCFHINSLVVIMCFGYNSFINISMKMSCVCFCLVVVCIFLYLNNSCCYLHIYVVNSKNVCTFRLSFLVLEYKLKTI